MLKKILFLLLLLASSRFSYAKHWIVFHAYPRHKASPDIEKSLAGHAYVSFIAHNELTKQSIMVARWGFYPIRQSPQAIFRIEGKVKDDILILPSVYNFVVEIEDISIFDACLNAKANWETKKYSVIASQTCVFFIRDILKRIPGIKVPNFLYQWPVEFLINLKINNSNIDQIGRKTLFTATGQGFTETPAYTEQEGVTTSNPNDNLARATNTPEALGELILSALKLNNKSLWSRCIDPAKTELNPSFGEANFYKFRELLQKDGVTNWNLLSFKKITYNSEYSGFQKEPDGFSRHVLRDYIVRFTYKNSDLVGEIGPMSVGSSKDGNYYIMHPGNITDVNLMPDLTTTGASHLIGGVTPDELGRNIFKALQTNNKSLFINCIHPHPLDDDRARIAKDFHRLREDLEERGLTQWSLAKYSRVVFSKEGFLTDDEGQRNGEQVRRNFTVEFTYKENEFIGKIEGGTIVTFNKKFFIWHGSFAAAVARFQ